MVVYHLVEKTGWSKLAVNETYQNLEWKFPWDVHVPFPRTSSPGRIQAERSRTREKANGTQIFRSDIPVGNFGLPMKTFRLFRKFPGRANQK